MSYTQKETTPVISSDESEMGGNNNKNSYLLPVFLCWLIYTSAYMGRYSYSSNLISIMNSYGVTHAKAGLVTTCFFCTYGIGQVINGILCRRYNKKAVIFLSLIISSAINLCVFFGAPFVSFKYLWILNGGAQSLLWSSLVCLLSENLRTKDIAKATVIMSTAVPAGTLLTYGLSAIEATFDGFMYSFLLGAIIMTACASVWLFLYKKAFCGYKNDETTDSTQNIENSSKKRKKTNAYMAMMLVIIGISVASCNLIKDGLTTWAPSILEENFSLKESLSIFFTLLMPILGMFGALLNTLIEKALKSYISVILVYYIAVLICIAAIISIAGSGIWVAAVLIFGIIALCMHAVNNFVTSMLPLYMRDRINSGLFAGVFNGFGYVGSMISSYGLGIIADKRGWNGVFYSLLFVCVVVALLCGIYEIFRIVHKKSQAEILR